MATERAGGGAGAAGLRGTLSAPGLWLGLVGSTLIGIFACSPHLSMSPDGWPWPPVQALGSLADPLLSAILLGVGFVMLTLGWWLVRPTATAPDPNRYLTLVVWSLPLLLVPPVLSPDAFLYADLGWIQHLGLNPYDTPVGTVGGPFVDQIDPLWVGSGVAYPPLALRASLVGAGLFGFDPYGGMLGQRLVALVGVALIAVFLPRLAQRAGGSSRWANWFGVLNPAVVLLFVGGAHNDAMMVGVVVGGLWLSTRDYGRVSGSLVVGPLVIGLAMCFKQQAGLAVLASALLPVTAALAAAPPLRRIVLFGWRVAAATLVAVVAFVVASLVTGLGFGWVRWLTLMGRAHNFWTAVLPSAWLQVVAVVPWVAVLALVWLILARPHHPIRIVALGSILVTLMGQILHPWYLVLGIVLLGADLPPARLVAALELSLEKPRSGSPGAAVPDPG